MSQEFDDHRGLTRRGFLSRVAMLGSAAALWGCQQPGPVAPSTGQRAAPGAADGARPALPPGWDDLVEGAKREGEINIYSAIVGTEGRAALLDAFEKVYPSINVQLVSLPNVQLIARVAAERAAGRHIADVLVGPGQTAIPAFKSDGALAAISPALMLPEVLDRSLWLNGRHWWLDAAEPYTAIGFQGQLQPVISHNTQLVDSREFTSYWDLLNPKWKGKIVARDVRQAGPGGPQVIYQYRHPELGRTFVERFWSEMDVTISVDARQMIDWLAQGQYVVGFAVNSRELREAARQGLPVGLIPPTQLKEGADLSHAGGTMNLMAQAPHPNAAKLYVNWLLSREGQIDWQQHTMGPSLRVDIPKDNLDAALLPKADVNYTSSSTEDFSRAYEEEVAAIIGRGLERARR